MDSVQISRGGTGWLALEPTGVRMHERYFQRGSTGWPALGPTGVPEAPEVITRAALAARTSCGKAHPGRFQSESTGATLLRPDEQRFGAVRPDLGVQTTGR